MDIGSVQNPNRTINLSDKGINIVVSEQIKIPTCLFSNDVDWVTLQMVLQTGKVKPDKGDVFSSSCGWRWRDCPADCQIPPLSWPSVLWSTSVSGAASWDLNNGGHSACSDKPQHVPPSPLLSPPTPSPPPTPPRVRTFPPSCFIYPPTRQFTSTAAAAPQNLIKSCCLSLLTSVTPLITRLNLRALPGIVEEAKLSLNADLFHFFSLLRVKSILFFTRFTGAWVWNLLIFFKKPFYFEHFTVFAKVQSV